MELLRQHHRKTYTNKINLKKNQASFQAPPENGGYVASHRGIRRFLMILCWNGQAPCFLFSSVRVRSCAEHVPPKKPPERSPSKPSPTGHYGLALNNFGVAHARCGAVVCSLRPWIACLCPRLGSHRLAVGGCQTAFGRAPEAPRYRQGYPLPASDAASPSPSTTASRFPRNTSTFAADRSGTAFRTPPRRRQHRRELHHSDRRDVYQEGRWQSWPPR